MRTKILSFFLAIIMVAGMSTTAFASEIHAPNTDVVGVFEIDAPNSSVNSLFRSAPKLSTGETSVSLIRNGNTSDVQVYLNWSGDFAISSFRFKKLTAKSTNALSSKTYGTDGNGRSYSTYDLTVSSKVASRYITTISIPTNVKRVKITVSGLQVHEMIKSSWISGLVTSKNITIN